MNLQKEIRLLKGIRLFANIPQAKLPTLAKFLERIDLKDSGVVFEQGSKGDSLFFVSTGRVLIQKPVLEAGGKKSFKNLAILNQGDCFGEMALFDQDTTRSARAVASGDTILFRLDRKQLRRWLSSNPSLAIGFFNELVQTLTRRLRRSSSELALLFDVSQWLLNPPPTGKELLEKSLAHLIPHLAGSWSGGAYLYNVFNEEMELIAAEGGFSSASVDFKTRFPANKESIWLDGRTYVVSFPGEKGAKGHLAFRHATALSAEEKEELARTLATAARLIASALENIEHHQEEALRARLAETRQAGRYVPGI